MINPPASPTTRSTKYGLADIARFVRGPPLNSRNKVIEMFTDVLEQDLPRPTAKYATSRLLLYPCLSAGM